MLLCEGELDVGVAISNACFLDRSSQYTRTTEIGSNFGLELRVATRDILSSLDSLAHTTVDTLPVGTTEHSAAAEERKRIILCSSIINCNVPKHIFTNLLGEVDVNAKEVGISLSSFNFLQQALEPTKRRSIAADPEELHTSERSNFAFSLLIPDVLQDRSEGGDTNTCTNEDSNFNLENVFSGSTVRAIDPDNRQGTGRACGIKLNEVATGSSVRVVLFVALHGSLSESRDNRRTSADAISESLSPVSNLTDMDRNIRIIGSGSDSEWMPLPAGDVGNLNKEPLASDVFETRLNNTELHGTTGMNKNLGQTSGPSGSDLSVNSLAEVDDTGPNSEPPALIAQAMLGRVKWESIGIVGSRGVTDEATSSMGVKTDHEKEGKVVGIPKGFKALCANLVVGGSIHQNHDKKHEMTSDAASLGIMNVQSNFRPDLGSLDIEEVNIVGSCVNHGPESHGVCDLTMEPDIFVSREKPGETGTNNANDVAKHGHENQTSVEGKYETCTSGGPDGPFQAIQRSQFLVCFLAVPSITKQEEMKAVEDDIED